MNDTVRLGINIINAVQALRFKNYRLDPHPEGVEIVQRGKPTLLLTARAAEEFAEMMEGYG